MASLRRKALAPARRRGVDVLVQVERREHHDPHLRTCRHSTASGLDPIQRGHLDVHEHDVGLELGDELDRLQTVRGLADHGEVVLGAEDHPEPRPDEPLVVSEEDADHALASNGRQARTAYPPPGQRPASTWPP